MSDLPSPIANPPARYDKLRQERGVCGTKVNLYYDGTVHRIWVTHAADSVHVMEGQEAHVSHVDAEPPLTREQAIEEYVLDFGRFEERYDDSAEIERAREEMREAVRQALEFYSEYEEVYEEGWGPHADEE